MIALAGRAVVGTGNVGEPRPLAVVAAVACTQRGVDGEDLAIADVRDRAGLGGLVPGARDGDVDVDDLGRMREREVLRHRPDDRTVGGAFERFDGRAETAPAEQELVVGADAGHDLEVPAEWVVRGAQAEELAREHGRMRTTAPVRASPDGTDDDRER